VNKLTPKQQAFVDEYLIDLNATQAAIRAKYSKKTAQEQSSRLLSNVMVANAISKAKAERNERNQIDADYVLKRLTEIDQLDVLDIVTDDLNEFKPLTEWPKAWRISISGIDFNTIINKSNDEDIETIVKKIKWPDKTKNLELLGKHISVQAFKENINNTGEVAHNVMLVPSCTDVGDWESQAKEQQEEIQKTLTCKM
jgi:phage terminase small subunit